MVVFHSVQSAGDKAPSERDAGVSSTSLARLGDGSTAPGVNELPRALPGHVHPAGPRDADDQSPARPDVLPSSHAHRTRSRDYDSQSAAGTNAMSQPVAELIRREFELLRAAPSDDNQTH